MLVKKLIEENVLEARSGKFNTGDLLFSAGDKPDFIYFLLAGSAKLTSPSGEELQLFVPGSLAGLADLLSERHVYSAYFCSPSEVLKISRQHLLNLIEQNPALRVYFLKLLSKGLARVQPLFE